MALNGRAGHRFSQAPHPMHFSSSIVMRNNEKRDRKPSTVPTGHTVLQYVRPPFQAKITTNTKLTAAIIKVGRERSHSSFS